MIITRSIYQLTFLVVLFAAFAGYNFMFADAPASPPANNAVAPLNVGSIDQIKNGGLSVNSLLVSGNMRVAGPYATFNQARAAQYCDQTGTRCLTPGVYDCPNGTALNQIRPDGTIDCVSVGSVTPPAPATYSWTTGAWGPWPFTFSGKCGNPRPVRTRSVTCVSSAGATVSDSSCSGTKPATSQSDMSSCSGDKN